MKPCPDLVSATVTSPIGPIIFDVCPNGLHLLKLSSEVTNENFLELASQEIELIEDKQRKSKCQDPIGPKVLSWLHNYFILGRETDVKICPEVVNGKDDFRQKVLLALKNQVKFGETISYGGLARLSGNPKAAQAVGSAVSNNPISFVIPCHRVIKSDGSAGNYSKGTKNGVKEWLLDFESPTKGENKTEESSESEED